MLSDKSYVFNAKVKRRMRKDTINRLRYKKWYFTLCVLWFRQKHKWRSMLLYGISIIPIALIYIRYYKLYLMRQNNWRQRRYNWFYTASNRIINILYTSGKFSSIVNLVSNHHFWLTRFNVICAIIERLHDHWLLCGCLLSDYHLRRTTILIITLV